MPTVEVGKTITLYAQPNPDGGGNPASPIHVTWVSASTGVATVADSPGTSSGQAVDVHGVSVGTSVITGTDTQSFAETVTVTVVAVGEPVGGFNIISGAGALP